MIDVQDRSDREKRVYTYLDDIGMYYERLDHEAVNTMEECDRLSEILGAKICKNLMLCNRQKTKFYLLMMPSDKPFKTKELSKQINSARLSFASPEYMLEYLDILPGALSVMGLMNDHNHHVSLLMDEDLFKEEYIGVHPCVNTSCIKIKMDELLQLYLPAVNHPMTKVTLIGE